MSLCNQFHFFFSFVSQTIVHHSEAVLTNWGFSGYLWLLSEPRALTPEPEKGRGISGWLRHTRLRLTKVWACRHPSCLYWWLLRGYRDWYLFSDFHRGPMLMEFCVCPIWLLKCPRFLADWWSDPDGKNNRNSNTKPLLQSCFNNLPSTVGTYTLQEL